MRVTTQPTEDPTSWILTHVLIANRQSAPGVITYAYEYAPDGYSQKYQVEHDNGYAVYHISELLTDEQTVLVFDPGVDTRSKDRNNYRGQLHPNHTLWRCPIVYPDIHTLAAFLQAYQPDVVEILNYYRWEPAILQYLLGHAAKNSIKVLASQEIGSTLPMYLSMKVGSIVETPAPTVLGEDSAPGDDNAAR